jgi:hypothetical protein
VNKCITLTTCNNGINVCKNFPTFLGCPNIFIEECGKKVLRSETTATVTEGNERYENHDENFSGIGIPVVVCESLASRVV